MANRPLSMHKLRQILIFLERGVSIRCIEKQVKISRKTIGLYQQKLLRTGLSLQELLLVKDQDLERLVSLEKVSPSEDADPRKAHFYSQIDYFTYELKHRTGVTRLILWEEYIKENPGGLQYSRF
ncbi:IS21 family transposase, partial [Dyadobacter sp. BHUBP1]